jgi:hypothetical protein
MAGDLRRADRLSAGLVQQIMDREVPEGSPSRAVVRDALSAHQVPRALALLMIAPELLWS